MTIEEVLKNINNYETTPTNTLIQSCQFMMDLKRAGRVNMQKIIELIEKHDLKSKDRYQRKTFPRFYLMNFIHQNTTLTLTNIGSLFNRDYSTVIHSINQHENLQRFDFDLYEMHTAAIREDLELLDKQSK